jgi:hypothetical protein
MGNAMPYEMIRMGYVLAMELLQSGKSLGQLEDETRAALDFFLAPENIRIAMNKE